MKLVYWAVFILTLGLIKLWSDREDIPFENEMAPLPARRRRSFPIPRLPRVPSKYGDPDEHLDHMLRYVDMLVRAQTSRWYLTIAVNKPPEAWGMVTVNPAEVEAFMTARFTPPGALPAVVQRNINRYVRYARKYRKLIDRAVKNTPRDVRLPLRNLMEDIGLGQNDVDLLLVAMLPALDSRYRRLFAVLQDDGTRMLPAVDLILQILQPVYPTPAEAHTAFLPDGPLRANRILVVEQEPGGERPVMMAPVQVDERIVQHVLGNDCLDDRLSGIVTGPLPRLQWDSLILEDEQLDNLKALSAYVGGQKKSRSAVVFVYGPYGSGRGLAARTLGSHEGDSCFLMVDVASAVKEPDRWPLLVDLCYREVHLHRSQATLVWTGCEALDNPELPDSMKAVLLEKAEYAKVRTVFTGDTPWHPKAFFRGREFVRFGIPMPSVEMRKRVWCKYLSPEELREPGSLEGIAETLAGAFHLTVGQILDALAAARSRAVRENPSDTLLDITHLEAGCRRQAGRRLHALATLCAPAPGMTMEDLIIPDGTMRQLDGLAYRISNRSRVFHDFGFDERYRLGQGLLALFTGSSGTGKTMAATILASQAGLDLYKVDMSRIVSKWVGETEKNLSRVFAEATDSNAILFFDEAENLFGKRSEVKDAKDRWANQEVAYLLQRVEEYAGVVIMATNLQQNIDQAFLRRIQVMIDFPFPDQASRNKIWKSMIEPGMSTLTDEDFDFMAEKFMLAGGNIRNVVIDSAFRTHRQEKKGSASTISFEHILLSVACEYLKLGRPLTPGLFGGKDRLAEVIDALYSRADRVKTSSHV